MESKIKTYPIWESRSFFDRQSEIRGRGLASLYPSQAWCMYRGLSDCSSVLEAGFGFPGAANNVQAITNADYLGIDSSQSVIEQAKPFETKNVRFERADILDLDLKRTFDAVMAWALIYSSSEPYKMLENLWKHTRKRLMFDARAIHGSEDIIDVKRSYGEYGGIRCHYALLGWDRLLQFLNDLGAVKIEFCSYYFPMSTNVHVDSDIPEPFVTSLIVHRTGEKSEPVGNLVPPRKAGK